MHICTGLDKLSQLVSASRGGSIGVGSSGSASADYTLLHSLDTSTTTLNIVVFAQNITGVLSAKSFRLKSNKVPTEGQFFLRYGDSFINEISYGTQFFGVISFRARTLSEVNAIKSDLATKSVYDGATLSANMDDAIRSEISSNRAAVSFTSMTFGSASGPAKMDPQSMITFALNLGNVPVTTPEIMDYRTSDYLHVGGLSKFTRLAAQRKYFDHLHAELVNIEAAREQEQHILDTYSFYGHFHDEQVNAAVAASESDIAMGDQQIEAHEKSPLKVFGEPPFKTPALGVPTLNFYIGHAEHIGGGGPGKPFFDVDASVAVLNHQKPSTIQFRGSRWIDSIAVTYSGYPVFSVSHGGTGGVLQPPISLSPDENIRRIWGKSGSFVNTMLFSTDKNPQQGFSGSTWAANSFSWVVPENSAVIGFSGGSDSFLDNFGVDYVTFEKAIWNH